MVLYKSTNIYILLRQADTNNSPTAGAGSAAAATSTVASAIIAKVNASMLAKCLDTTVPAPRVRCDDTTPQVAYEQLLIFILLQLLWLVSAMK